MIRLPPASALHGLAVASVALTGLALSGCAQRQPMSQRDAATISACRQRAEQIYTQQNRAELFQTNQTNSPFGASGLTGMTSAGLGQRYGYDTTVNNCVRNSEAQTEGAPAANPQPAVPPATRTLRMPPPQ